MFSRRKALASWILGARGGVASPVPATVATVEKEMLAAKMEI